MAAKMHVLVQANIQGIKVVCLCIYEFATTWYLGL